MPLSHRPVSLVEVWVNGPSLNQRTVEPCVTVMVCGTKLRFTISTCRVVVMHVGVAVAPIGKLMSTRGDAEDDVGALLATSARPNRRIAADIKSGHKRLWAFPTIPIIRSFQGVV